MLRLLRSRQIYIILLCFCTCAHSKAIDQKKIIGIAHVRDGDSLRIGKYEVRLFGVDAFELTQTCGKMACGKAARSFMRERIEGRLVICAVRDRDKYRRYIAVCKTQSGQDLGSLLVRQGLGVAYRTYSYDYIGEESAAKASKAGAWAFGFQSPLNYRKPY